MAFNISMLKNAIPTKSYSLVMLHLFNTKYLSCTTPMRSLAIGSYFLTHFSFFNPHAIHERKPRIEYGARDIMEKTKKE